MCSERLDQGPTVMPQSGLIVIGPFCIKANVHAGKDN